MGPLQFDPILYLRQAWASNWFGKTTVIVAAATTAILLLAGLLVLAHRAIKDINPEAVGLPFLVWVAAFDFIPPLVFVLILLMVFSWILALTLGSRAPKAALPKLFRPDGCSVTYGGVTPSMPGVERFAINIFNDADVSVKNCFAQVLSFKPMFNIHTWSGQYPEAGDPVPWIYGDEALHNITVPPKQTRRLLIAIQDSQPGHRNTFVFPVSLPGNSVRPVVVPTMAEKGGYQVHVEIGTDDIPSLPTSIRFLLRNDDDGRVEIGDVRDEDSG